MATAIRSTPLPVTPPPTTVTLTLSEEEARAILVVCAKVGGPREGSPRKHTQAVYEALLTALGVWTTLDMPESAAAAGDIHFSSL
ncbi:hypothetical protein AB0J27_20385 [Micromonospora chokoriensis]